jgi:hypothetical protein
VGILNLLNQRKQTRVMEDQLQMFIRREGNVEEWARKYDEAVAPLTKVAAGTITTGPSTSTNAYQYIFSNDNLRSRIERYLGRPTFFRGFRPTSPTKEQLLSPVIQETIQQVLETITVFRTEHTDYARALKLSH